MLSKFGTALTIVLAGMLATTPACARITGITAPSQVTPGQEFDVTFKTSAFIENEEQYYVVFGLSPPTYPQDEGLYSLIGTGYDLVANGQSGTGTGHFNVSITIPSDFTPSTPNNSYVLTAAVFSTIGARFNILVNQWPANVTVV